MLSTEEKRVLSRLSVFRGGFTRLAAELVVGAKLPVLAALLSRSLIRRTSAGRYDLHELVRQYAASKLADSPQDLDMAQEQHSLYYLALLQEKDAELHSADQKRALAELTADIDNIRAAWEWSTIRKRRNFQMGLAATRLGLGFLLKPLLKKGPPFNYFHTLSPEAEDYVLRHLTRIATYRAALDEYAYIDPDRRLPELEEARTFPQIPFRLICHAPEMVTAEIEKFGHVDHATATRLENLWMSVMKEYLEFSPQAIYLQSEKSGHHLHLGDPDLIRQALDSLI